MNQMQTQIAEAIREHFKRQDRCMHRDGPVARIQADQDQFIADLVRVFQVQNPSFEAIEFIKASLP